MIEITPEQQEHLKTLVTALRDGSYKQGKSRLRTLDGTFCCLGVAADLCDNTKWASSGLIGDRWADSLNYLPQTIASEYYGFSGATEADHAHRLYKPGSQFRYAHMNDQGKTFAEIADAIEEDFQLLERGERTDA